MDILPPADDSRRLELLQMLGLLNADPDPAFDKLTRIAASATGSEIAFVSFVGADRIWIRSRVGAEVTEVPLDYAFCTSTIASPGGLEVADASRDARFVDNEYVRGARAMRSYAGFPIVYDGIALGAFGVLDPMPRRLTPAQGEVLADLAGMVESLLQLRRQEWLLREERRHAVELAGALRESEAMLTQAQRVARLGSWELDVETGAAHWSEELYAIVGRGPHEGPLGVDDFRARVHPDDAARFQYGMDRAFVQHLPAEREFRFRMPDGRWRWLHTVSEPVLGADGRLLRLSGTMQDVTERKESERRVRESADRDRLLWQTTTDVVLTLDEDSRVLFCNPAVADVFGYQPEDLVGRPLDPLQPERLRGAHRGGFARYLATNERRLDWRGVETTAVHRDGHEFPIEISFSDMQIDGRRVFGAFIRDITARKQQQAALQRSEERYRRIVQTAEEGIWMIDAASDTTFVNPKMARMLGYEVDEMVGRNLFEFMDEAAAAQARENLQRRARGIAEQHDFRLRRKDGSALWTAMSTSPALDEQGRYAGALAMVTDITERRLAEDALRASEARFRSLTALSSDWYWEQDAEFRLTKVVGGSAHDNSIGLRRILGQKPWEASSIGMDLAAWQRHREQLEAHLPFRDFEISHAGRDGQLSIISVSGEPVWDDEGRFSGYRGVGRDVTEQRRGQVVRLELEAQLREAQKMEAIGVLAGGIAHDFNNVLAGILGNVALALQDLPAGHPGVRSVEQIRKASLRGRGLVQQILAFARRQPREIVDCELRPLVDESVGLLRATLPAGVTLEAGMCDEPLHVLADATQVEQVLMNLCTNAWHALEGGAGRVGLRLEAVTLDAEAARRVAPVLPAGRYARLSVQDNGRGMDARTRSRIFEPFFTTKPVGEGTGLGLAVAHGIVAAHGGAIVVETAEGAGSTFSVYLPRVEPAIGAERPAPPAVTHRGRGERVLYIDDDEVIIVMVERMLERLGYQPTCMADALAAIETVQADPGAFDVAVTDLNMPQLSGLDVARALACAAPDLPVIISSGNLPDQLQAEARQAGVRALLHKQYTLEELGAVIHWVLAGGQRLGLEPLQASR
jgi:PAS domain S-box-containing protein